MTDKYCINCKYQAFSGGVRLCDNPALGIDLVTAKPIIVECASLRYNAQPDQCGKDAIWFQPKGSP
jgi:hypothetical protein